MSAREPGAAVSTTADAVLNAFGFAGINAHAILEEHAASADDPEAPGALLRWESEAVLLGAPDRATWLELARALLAWLDRGPDVVRTAARFLGEVAVGALPELARRLPARLGAPAALPTPAQLRLAAGISARALRGIASP